MKKLAMWLCAAVMAAVMAVTLAACTAGGVEGTYKFQSMRVEAGGMVIEYNVGDSLMGVSFTEDYITLEIEEDNTFSISVSLLGDGGTGTWELNDDGNVVLISDGDQMIAVRDGNTLTLETEEDGAVSKLVLVKK